MTPAQWRVDTSLSHQASTWPSKKSVAQSNPYRPWLVPVAVSLSLLLLVSTALLLSAFNQGLFRAQLLDSGLGGQLKLAFFGPPRVTLQENSELPRGNDTFDHRKFEELLANTVDEDGWVDYARVKEDRDQLTGYLSQLAAADLSKLGRDEQLALLINAYNAFTLQLIVEHYPIKSIKDIRAADRWEAKRWMLAGRLTSLNQIEHELIRPNFAEPRIHFALVCAAVGCPPLRAEAYTGDKLEQQLAAQSQYVHSHRTWYATDGRGTLKLTRLYEWYGDDFVQTHGSVLAFVANFDTEIKDRLHRGQRLRTTWLPYDWNLNDTRNRQQR